MSSFKLTILGSSAALPVYGRFPTSQYLEIQGRHFLVDCGEGCQLQLKRYELGHGKINHILISHLHGDHYLGLPGLLFSMHLLQRQRDLHIYSFAGLHTILLEQLRQARSVLNFRVHFHPLAEGESEVIMEDDVLTVRTIPMDHKIPTCGFLFTEKPKPARIDKTKLTGDVPIQSIAQLKRGEDVKNERGEVLFRSADYTLPPKSSRSYAFCSDTQPSDSIVHLLQNVDLLYHEATFLEDEKEKARETKHSTAAEAALIAKKCHAGKLILGHFSARYKDLDAVLAEATAIFPETALGIEGETFELTD